MCGNSKKCNICSNICYIQKSAVTVNLIIQEYVLMFKEYTKIVKHLRTSLNFTLLLNIRNLKRVWPKHKINTTTKSDSVMIAYICRICLLCAQPF